MDSQQGRVLAVHDDRDPAFAVVEVAAPPSCARCAAGKGCGAGIVGGEAGPRSVEARLAPGLTLHQGDRVRIELAPGDILHASLVAYGLPLVGAVVGAGAAHLAGAGDLIGVLTTVSGGGAGVLMARGRLRQSACRHRIAPIVTARIAGAS